MKLYHQIDRLTGEVIDLFSGRPSPETFDYLLRQDHDIFFIEAWRKSWPGVNPLVSELKLFRKWLSVQRQFKAIHLRPEGITQ